jgi:hypothetical protein
MRHRITAVVAPFSDKRAVANLDVPIVRAGVSGGGA